MNLDQMLVRSHPGEGLVGRFAGVAFVAVPASPRHDAMVDQLLTMAEDAAAGPTPGRRLARHMAGVLASAEPEDVPAFCLLAQAETGLVLILHGAMEAEVSWPNGSERLSGQEVATWVDRILPPPIIELVVTRSGHPAPRPDPRSRLVAGVVAGAGLSLQSAAAQPTPTEAVPHAPPPAAAPPIPKQPRSTAPPSPPAPPPPAVAPPPPAPPSAPAPPPPSPAPQPVAAAAAPPPAPDLPPVAEDPRPGAGAAAAPLPAEPGHWPQAEPAVAPLAAQPPPWPAAEPAAAAQPPPWPAAEPAAAPPAAWPPPSAGSQIPPPPASQEDPTLLAGMAPPSAGIGTEPVPAEPLPFIAVALADPAVPPHPEEVREPLPIAGVAPAYEEPPGPKVRGVICSRGHFNDPAAPFCGVCGISMVQRTLNLVEGPRPPLGVIVFDDGTTFTLDADYVLGREPENDPSVISGDARPLALTDPDRTVSRVHAGLVLDGWSVKAVDRGSANGTFMAAPGEDSWAALTPNRPTTIKPGTRLRVGQRVFLFDSHQGTR